MPRKFKAWKSRKSSKTSTFNKTVKFTSPYASAFKSGVKSGTPCGTVISNICKKTGKPMTAVIKSLNKAGLCFCQKFNGTFVCWPTFKCTTTSNKFNPCQTQMWQCLVDWCCMSGTTKPTQLWNKIGSQKSFMSACKSLFGKQMSVSSTSAGKSKPKSKRRPSSASKRSRKTWSSPKTRWAKHTKKRTVRKPSYWSRTYKFPTHSSRKFVRAA